MAVSIPTKDDWMSTGAGNIGPFRTAHRAMYDFILQMAGNQTPSELTIATDTLTAVGNKPSQGLHIVDTEADAATDFLDNAAIDNFADGRLWAFRPADAARVPTVRHNRGGSGQFLLADGADFEMRDTTTWLIVRLDGTSWVELDRIHGADARGALTFIRAIGAARAVKTGDYTILAGDRGALLVFDASAAARTATLPSPATVKDGFIVGVMKSDASKNTVTAARNGANINGAAADRVLRTRWQVEWYRTDGTNWEVIAGAGDGLLGRFARLKESAQTDNYTITAVNAGQMVLANKATAITLSLDPAATLGAEFGCFVKNINDGDATLDPNGAETIDGAATLVLKKGQWTHLWSDGTNFRSLGAMGTPTAGEIETINIFIPTPANQDYTLDEFPAYAYDVVDLVHKTSAGTMTAAIKIDGNAVTNISAAAVTSTQSTATASGANSGTAGQRLTLTVSSVSSAANYAATLKLRRKG